MMLRRSLRILVAAALSAGAASSPGSVTAQAVPYDIVYVRQPRFGNTTNTTWPEVFHPARLDPGADLMLLHPNGTQEVLVAGGNGAVTDPFVSFDGQSVFYSYFYDQVHINSQRGLPWAGADIFRINLQTREIQQLTHAGDPRNPGAPLPSGEFTPNTGAAHWYQSAGGAYQPTDVPNPYAYDHLGYGIFNLAPAPVAGAKIIFSSNRNGFAPPKGYTNPTLQLFVMDDDGSNVTQIAPMNISSALHPTPLRDGRVMFSSHESQGLRDSRLWGIWYIYPDGRRWGPLVSAFRDGQAFHFMTQLSNDDVVLVDYYNLNNNGFGALYRMPIAVPAGTPHFFSAFPDDNPSIQQTVGGGFVYPFRMPFTPWGLYSIVPFTHANDEAAPIGPGGVRVGKFTHPSGAPGNDLLVVWTPGPANDLNRPTSIPYYDAGLYLIRGGNIVASPSDLVLLKNDPNYNEAWPRAVVPYSAVHGVAEPAQLPWLPNDGTVHAELPAGTPYGLVGTSSVYKRESFPGYVPSWSDTFDGLDAFNTLENGQSSNWFTQGSDAGTYSNSDIWAIRILAMEAGTHRSYGPNGGPSGGQRFSSHAMERLRILGEIPLRKANPDGTAILDPEGNPDTSFLVKIPADTPFTFQTIDRNGLVLNMAQTWHQVRPGEMRSDCGGCHAHSQQPLAFSQTYAARPQYPVADLSTSTPLLTQDASGNPALRTDPARAVDVEFFRDVRPLLQRSCVPCHTRLNPSPPGALVLDDYTNYHGVPGDYARLADDQGATWGYPPVIGFGWRQSNASRYIRMFQSRRSLLVWKIFGQRLDGWTNGDHPTESAPGNAATLPPGASMNAADLDFTGTIMPPLGSGVAPLSIDEKMMIARWIDLGAPIDSEQSGYGWFLDENRPTLEISLPRAGHNAAVSQIRIGVADAYSGIKPTSLSVTTDVAVERRAPGVELASLAAAAGDGIYAITLSQALPPVANAHLFVSVSDNQGNINRVERRFSVAGATPLPTAAASATPTRTPTPSAVATQTSTATAMRTATRTPTRTPTHTATRSATRTASPAPTLTSTVPPTSTPTLPAAWGIAGAIRYYANAQPLSGATLGLTGSPGAPATTDGAGAFAFSNLGATNWRIEPYKVGDGGGAVSSLDAVYALQADIGSRTLSAAQRLACDVSGNGTVSALDASLILRYKIGAISSLPAAQACASDWLFIVAAPAVPNQIVTPPVLAPGTCQRGALAYAPLAGSAANQDFSAVLFGDCTGNWQPPTGGSSLQTMDRTSVRLGALVRQGRLARLPLFVDAATPFHSVDLRLRYDPALVSIAGIRRRAAGRHALVATHTSAPGVLDVALASAEELHGGALLSIQLTTPATNRTGTVIRVEHAVIER